MKELVVPGIMASIGAALGSVVTWIFGGTIWVGALIGAVMPLVFFAGAMLAVLGMFKIAADYLKENAR